MAVPQERLQAIVENKDVEAAAASCAKHRYVEGWRITDDGALVIYDVDHPPAWLAAVIEAERATQPEQDREPPPAPPDQSDRCTYCGKEVSAPVEMHHHESECVPG